MVFTEYEVNKLLKNEIVQNDIEKFVKKVKDAVPMLKNHVAAIREICEKLQEWIDDLTNQELAVNVTNTATTAATAVSAGLLFTPLAPFGLIGLAGAGISATATAVGDGVANHVKGKRIQEVANEKKDLIDQVENCVQDLG